MIIDDNDNIYAIYSYIKDKRKIKTSFPEYIKKNKKIIIAFWSKDKMKNHVNSKFNQKGFFICKKNKENKYDKNCFGGPITFEFFINNIKNGVIFFDSGMYQGNPRMYSQWRASSIFWDKLITEEY